MKFDALIQPDSIGKYSAQIKQVVEACKQKGKRVHLIVAPEVISRTTPQRNHLNGHITQFCNETGNDFDDVKNYIKRKAIKRGYPIKQRAGVDVMFRGLPVGISEADASVEECGYLIDEIHILASECGIILKED